MKSLFVFASVLILRVFLNGAPAQDVYLSGSLYHPSGREYVFECVSDSDGFCYVDIGSLTGLMRGNIVFDSWGDQEILFLAEPDSKIVFSFDLNQMTRSTENQPYTGFEAGLLDVERMIDDKTPDNAANLRPLRAVLLLVFVGGVILTGWFLYNRIRHGQN